jgi:uncharacterized protein (TIGR02246 family)
MASSQRLEQKMSSNSDTDLVPDGTGPGTVLRPVDELEIRALVARYHDANNRGDQVAWAATWSTEGQWHVGPRTLVGRQAMLDFWQRILAPYESRIVQLVAHGQIRVSADGVVGDSMFLEFARKTGEPADHVEIGRYEDRYVREDGRWVFAERRFALIYRSAISAGEFFAFPDTA